MQPIEREPNRGPDPFETHRFVEQLVLQHTCGLNAAEIDELVGYGALAPQPASREGARRFGAEYIEPLREAARLRHEHGLNLFAVGLILGYLTRIERLEQRIDALHVYLPHAVHSARDGPAPWREPHG